MAGQWNRSVINRLFLLQLRLRQLLCCLQRIRGLHLHIRLDAVPSQFVFDMGLIGLASGTPIMK